MSKTTAPNTDHDESIDAHERRARALEQIEDELRRIANSDTPFAPRAQNALDELEGYRQNEESDDAE